MAYIGIRLDYSNGRQINVKLHGPMDTFAINTLELREFVQELARIDQPNLMYMCEHLANAVIEKYGNGTTVLWAEAEVSTGNGVIVGKSAEKVLV